MASMRGGARAIPTADLLVPETLAMSNMIAPVSLDFDSTGSVCDVGKGV
jgi:hypothetical protein